MAESSLGLLCRSLAAAEQLSKAGFGQLAWINGGFDAAAPSDLPVKDAADLRFGGIGGLSEVLGWTEVQKQTSSSEGFLGGGFTIIKAVRLVALSSRSFQRLPCTVCALFVHIRGV